MHDCLSFKSHSSYPSPLNSHFENGGKGMGINGIDVAYYGLITLNCKPRCEVVDSSQAQLVQFISTAHSKMGID